MSLPPAPPFVPFAAFVVNMPWPSSSERSSLMKRLVVALGVVVVIGLIVSRGSLARGGAGEEPRTFKVDEEGYVRNWLLLEPVKLTEDIANHEEEQEKPVFAKEWVKAEHRPKAGDKLKVAGKAYEWVAKDVAQPVADFTEIFADKDHEQCIFLGVFYVVADKDIDDVRLSIGSDDSSVWRVNGKEVIRVYAGRDYDKDTDKSQPLTLKKGVNVVELAVTQGDGPSGAVARFLDKGDRPVTGIAISLTPPGK